MPPKKVKVEKGTGNEALMAVIRDSNRWAELEDRKDYQDRTRRFMNAHAGIETKSSGQDILSGRILKSKWPTRSRKRTEPGRRPFTRQYGSLAWVEGHVHPERRVVPTPFQVYGASKTFPPGLRNDLGPHTAWPQEEFSLNSHGPRVDPDGLDDVYDGFGATHGHSMMGLRALVGTPIMQQTELDLRLARSAAVNSVLDYVLERHAPKTCQ